jgi:hypothetical protein
MKKISLLLLAAFLLSAGKPATVAAEGGNVLLFSDVEYWGRGKAFKKLIGLWEQGLRNDLAGGIADAGSVSSKVTDGSGIRAGVFFPSADGSLAVGMSAGYTGGWSVFEVD